LANQTKINVEKSAGPATVILSSLPQSELTELEYAVSKPINIVGHLF
jgi:hypothetical protein